MERQRRSPQPTSQIKGDFMSTFHATSGLPLSPRLSRRTLLGGLGAVGLTAGLAACAPGGGGQPPTGSGGGGDNIISYWSFDAGRVAIAKHVAESQAFGALHPGVKLEIQQFPYAQMHDKLLAALVSGRGAPDMADIEIGRFPQYIGSSKVPLVDVTDRIGAEIDQLVVGAATAPWTWQDRVYGIGTELNVITFAYRHDIMEKPKIEVPFKTWDEVVEAGRKVSASGEMLMFALHDRALWDWNMMHQTWGGSFFKADGTYDGDSEEGVASLTWLRDLIYKEKIAGIAPATAANAYNGPEYFAAFADNKYAAMFGPPWLFTGLLKTVPTLAGKWSMQTMPTGLGASRPTALIGGTGQAITAQSGKPDVCWDLMKLTNFNVDSSKFEFESRTVYPTYKPALSEPWLREPVKYFGNQRIGEVYGEVAEQTPPWVTGPTLTSAMEAAVRVAVTPVMNNKKEPRAALAEVRQELQ
jgi:arabinosaccharide transport system substrate-binding protein